MTINKSLLDINKVIKLNGGKPSAEQEADEQELITNNQQFSKFMNEKRLFKIIIYKDNDLVGLRDVVIEDKYLCSLECISLKAEAFSIENKVIYLDFNLYFKLRSINNFIIVLSANLPKR